MDYKEITKKAYEEIAEDYSKRDAEIVDETFDVKSALDRFISLLQPHSKVLDIGSGGGRDSRYLYKKGFNVTGIDFSEQMIRNAKERNTEIAYLQMDLEKISFPGNSFHGIWANASLHHIPKDHLLPVLERIADILKNDGIFFIKIKHGTFDGIREIEKFGKLVQRHFSYYLPEELVNMVESTGFTIIDSYLATSGEWLDIIARK